MGKRKRKNIKSVPDKIKASTKYKITDPEEMEDFINIKNSAHISRDKTKYTRKVKHKNRLEW